jgi:hypothetical protein
VNNPELGKLITTEQYRDAVHVAIAPVTVVHACRPGEHFGLMSHSTTEVSPHAETKIGIIDPFLSETVQPQQRCWLLLYPNTVTSLRHVWTHEAFRFVPKEKP